MKTHSWTTRNYATNSKNPNASYQAFRCSWLFSTGMGNTNRYIGSMQVRVPAYGNGSHEVKLAGYALGNSEGSSYYSDTSSVCEQSNFPTAIAGLHLIRSARHEKRTSLHTAFMLMQKRDTAISVPAVGTHESNVSATRALSHQQARH